MLKREPKTKDVYTEVGLPEFNAVGKKTKDNGDILYVLEPKERPICCPECGSIAVYVHKVAPRKVQDLPMSGHRVGLSVQGKSYRCKDCGNLIRMDYPSLQGRMTKRLVEAIQVHSLPHTFTDTANMFDTTVTTVSKLFNEYADAKMAEHRFVAPTVLGIDEVHLEDEYRGVFVSVGKNEGHVLEFTRSRTQKSVEATLRTIEQPENLKLVTMDMWLPYKKAVNTVFPDTPIVIDHFHVIKNLLKAMDTVRASITRQIKKTDRRVSLKHNRFLMLASSENLTTNQNKALKTLFAEYPELETIYLLKEAFRDIYATAKNPADARAMFAEWQEACLEQDITAYDDFIKTVENWETEIFAYFEYPDLDRTNAQTEGLNRKIREIASNGRGYTFDVLRKKVILSSYKLEPRQRFTFDDFLD